MRNWMLRGLVFAAAMVVLRLLQGALINAWQTQAGLISIVLLILFVIGVVIWGVLDGRADATAQPDPDRRQDLAMTWLLAGLLAGILSGAVSWLIALFYQGLYTGGLINEVTTFAAFTALLVFVPGIIGVAVGRWRIDRNPPPRPHGGDEERADTDVFSAVRGDETPTGEIPAQTAPGAQAEERTGSIATAERDAPTETIPTAGDDAKTEVIRTDEIKHAKPGEEPEKG
ncbi:B-4DMT family transporter [Mycobacterium sp. E3198]|uniref:B-4DMT family transporter n=1 Tax=Mycobacterium sp. E3198 TaxID=1834143 RepID=UPI000801B3CA|nr:B-4DMT family transporter [Mycobacterium sp. E3198]OBG36640.1 hypothetical protein A5673_17515 [Mycobacterium sp. E3198]